MKTVKDKKLDFIRYGMEFIKDVTILIKKTFITMEVEV